MANAGDVAKAAAGRRRRSEPAAAGRRRRRPEAAMWPSLEGRRRPTPQVRARSCGQTPPQARAGDVAKAAAGRQGPSPPRPVSPCLARREGSKHQEAPTNRIMGVVP